MGHAQAEDMAAITDLDTGLVWHLRSNHYPPLPLSLVETCKQAITAANEDDWDREIPLPDPITYKDNPHAPAYEIISAHHLDAWVANEDVFE